ncbi:MAG: YhjD/YihY/BrkB family envelope integrity protein, partial [Bacteroidota bacterium]
MKRIPKSIRNSSFFKDGLLWLRKSRINRKDRVPVLTVLQFLYKKLTKNNVHQQASAIAFSFMLSLFPAILFFISLIPYVAAQLQIPNLLEQVLDILQQGVPQGIYEFIEPTISDIIQNKSVGLLSFGFFFAVYAATSGVVELMHTFNLNYAYSEKRSFIKKRLVAIWLAFLFA